MTGFAETALRADAFLGGGLTLWQPRQGYRAGVDPVLLAAAVPARAGDRVLDLGCGAGAVSLCLARRVEGVILTGVERHPGYAALARRNAAAAGAALDVIEADIGALPGPLRQVQFDFVVANPPYFDRADGTASPDPAREEALGEATPLAVWLDVAARRLRPKGYLYMILKAHRLQDALCGLSDRLGSTEILPLAPRPGRSADLVVLRARKEGRAALILHAPVILHEGPAHPGDREHYRPEISAVLRQGAPLEFPAR